MTTLAASSNHLPTLDAFLVKGRKLGRLIADLEALRPPKKVKLTPVASTIPQQRPLLTHQLQHEVVALKQVRVYKCVCVSLWERRTVR